MLSTQEIAGLIQYPKELNRSEIENLKVLAEKFPFAQTFVILYLQALANAKDVLLEDEIQRLAIRIQDRGILYHLLQPQDPESKTVVLTNEFDAPQTIITEEIEILGLEETEVSIPFALVTEPESFFDNIEENTSVEEVIELLIVNEKITTDTILNPSLEETSNLSLIESSTTQESIHPEIKDKTIDTSYQNQQYSIEKIEKTIPSNEEVKQENIDEIEIERQRLIEKLAIKPKVIAGQKTEENKKEENNNSPKSFTSWLKSAMVEEVNQPETIQTTAAIKETSDKTIIQGSALYILEQEEQKITSKVPVEDIKKKDFSQIIDKFIKEDPKISTPKKTSKKESVDRPEMYNPLKKAKESINDAQLPVSETLAKIFVVQGNFPKAIFAYQQLMLIFPEKKTFFAKQIKELEQKLNTK